MSATRATRRERVIAYGIARALQHVQDVDPLETVALGLAGYRAEILRNFVSLAEKLLDDAMQNPRDRAGLEAAASELHALSSAIGRGSVQIGPPSSADSGEDADQT